MASFVGGMKAFVVSVTIFSSKINKVDILGDLIRIVPGRSFVCCNSSTGTPCNAGALRQIQTLAYRRTGRLVLGRRTGKLIITYGATADTTIHVLERRCPSIPVMKVRPTIGPTVLFVRGPEILIVTAPVAVERRGLGGLVSECERLNRVVPLPYPKLVGFIRENSLCNSSIERCLRRLLCSCSRNRVSTIILKYARCPFIEGVVRRILKSEIHIFSKKGNATHRVGEHLTRGNLLASDATTNVISFRGDLAKRDRRSGVRLYGRLFGGGV